MKNNPLILTLDFGTQSVRAGLTNKKGETIAISKLVYEPAYNSPFNGAAEQEADFYWDVGLKCLKDLCDKNKELLPNIIGSAITTFRDTAVQLDKNLKPLRPCVLWLDQRMAVGKEKLPWFYRLLFAVSGMRNTIELNRKRTMAHWCKENQPSIWSKTYKYVNISTYLTFKLTGNLCDSVSSMTGHYPIHFRKRKWYKEGALKGCIFGIPNRMLCELKQPGEVLGTIKDDIAEELGLPKGIKLYATGSDKACETIGLGALSRSFAAVSYGTASSIEVSNKKYYEPETFLPAYAAAVPGWFNMDVQIYRGYWMLTWFSKNFASDLKNEAKQQKSAIEAILDSRLADVPPGSDGLVLQPYWGPGLSRPLAKGAIIGFSDVHTRDHLYRSIIEGIAYALKEGLHSIEKHQNHKVREIRISGGGSQSDAICQITADIFNLPVSRVQTYETTTLGAAIAAFVAAGEFNNVEEAMKAMTHVTMTFSPNEVAAQQYKFLYKNIYVNMYPQLKDVYKSLNVFTKKIK